MITIPDPAITISGLRNNAFATPLPPIRTSWYFREIIREMLDRPPGPREIEQMREALLHQ